MKTAIVADWLTTYGGAEHVIAELRALFPHAPIFTTVAKSSSIGPLADADIRTSHLQRIYNLTRNHQVLLSLMPRAIESIDLTGFDVIISSSHAVGKGIIPPPSALHICYCHTPMRYAWEMEDQYLHDFRIPGILKGVIKRELAKLRRWDLTTAKRTDMFIANSTTTQERIKRIYKRESIVIPPPVEDKFFAANSYQLTANSSPYFLAVGRLVPYKRFDLLIELANKLQLPLKIAGRGQDEDRLKKLAGPTVEFLGYVPDNDLPSLYARADALFFPQYEDAGIVLLEAQASGAPVIAYKAGGATDVVVEGKTGVFFDAQTVDSMLVGLEKFKTLSFDRHMIRQHAKQFSQGIFRQKMTDEITRAYDAFRTGRFTRV